MEILPILGSGNTQHQQNNSPQQAATKTEEPAAKTVQPAQQGENSADAGRDSSTSADGPFAPSQTSRETSGAAVEDASAEAVLNAQLADSLSADDLDALARASAERAQTGMHSLLDGIAVVDAKPTAAPQTSAVNDNPTEPRTTTPVDTYA